VSSPFSAAAVALSAASTITAALGAKALVDFLLRAFLAAASSSASTSFSSLRLARRVFRGEANAGAARCSAAPRRLRLGGVGVPAAISMLSSSPAPHVLDLRRRELGRGRDSRSISWSEQPPDTCSGDGSGDRDRTLGGGVIASAGDEGWWYGGAGEEGASTGMASMCSTICSVLLPFLWLNALFGPSFRSKM
jgi:hypothetical protein